MNMLNMSKYTQDKNGMEVVRLVTPELIYGSFDFNTGCNIEISLEKIDYMKPSSLIPDFDDENYPYKDILRCAELKAVMNGRIYMINVIPFYGKKENMVVYNAGYYGENWEDLPEEEDIPEELMEEIDCVLFSDYCTEDEHRMGLLNPVNEFIRR